MRNNTSQENLRCEEIFDQKIQEISQKKGGCRNPTEKTMGRQFEGLPFLKPTHPEEKREHCWTVPSFLGKQWTNSNLEGAAVRGESRSTVLKQKAQSIVSFA